MIPIPTVIQAVPDEDDRSFLESFYLEHRHLMFKTAMSIVEDYQIAEDMVSEACLSIIRSIDQLRKFNTFIQRKYVVSIIRNASISYVRKRNRQSKYNFLAEDMRVFDASSGEDGPDRDLILQVESEELQRALGLLSVRDRTLLKMKYFEKASDTEIANVLNISVNSVRSLLTVARRMLQKLLEGRL